MDAVHGNLSKYVPLDAFMNLRTLAFTCSLLISTATGAGTAAGTG